MKKVGLACENPNDTGAVMNLLSQKHKDVQFVPLVRRFEGHQMDTPKFRNALALEFKDKKLRHALVVRDLDDFESNKRKVKAKREWFNELDNSISNRAIFLLNIWELEALVLADIKTFNRIYGVTYSFTGNPMLVKDPKGELERITRRKRKEYSVNDTPDLFKKLNFNTVKAKCKYFAEFIVKFETFISQK